MTDHKFRKLESLPDSTLVSGKCEICNEPIGSAPDDEKLSDLYEVHVKKAELKKAWNG